MDENGPSQKETIVFQPSIFRCELFVSRSASLLPMKSVGGAARGVLDVDEVQYNEQIAHWIASWVGEGVEFTEPLFWGG